jgi:hypothetical protein
MGRALTFPEMMPAIGRLMRHMDSLQRKPMTPGNYMKHYVYLLAVGAALAASVSFASTAPSSQERAPDALFADISAMDAAVFDSFNRCSSPEELQKHASYFDPEVEFYHDTGGVTWNREDMLANTEKHACGNYRRELVPDSLRIFPVKEFGAIEQGVHRFCRFDTGACDGMADFVIVWRLQDDKWRVTRILSYGHRASEQ